LAGWNIGSIGVGFKMEYIIKIIMADNTKRTIPKNLYFLKNVSIVQILEFYFEEFKCKNTLDLFK